MWFKVGIKDTNWYNCIELDSEDKDKILDEWFAGAYYHLNNNYVLREDFYSSHTGEYPSMCEVEMMERPPKEWLERRIEQFNKCMDNYVKEHNELVDILHTYTE